jgi:hypothetical protein
VSLIKFVSSTIFNTVRDKACDQNCRDNECLHNFNVYISVKTSTWKTKKEMGG